MLQNDERPNWFFRTSKRKLYVLAALIRLFLIGFFGESWDIYVFIESARQFVDEGVTPYQTALNNPPTIYMPYYPFTENWYAYPPLMLLIFSFFFILAKSLGLTNPLFIRFLIKLPVSLSDLLLAYSVDTILGEFNVSSVKRRYAELLILFNPFFVLVGSVWGMFDILVSSLIAISMYYTIRERFLESSIFIALAVLAKQTALFITPLLFFYWIKKRGFGKALGYALAAIGVFVSVSIPFFLSSPSGFLQQVLLMHVGRPPWGYNIYTALYFMSVFLLPSSVTLYSDLLIVLIGIFSSISLSLMLLTIIFLSLKVLNSERKEDLILLGLLSYLAFVFLNKVTNEPYFVYSMTFLLIYAFTEGGEELIKLYRSFSYTMFTATLIAATRFVIFLPSDILVLLLGHDVAEALWEISPYYGETNPFVVATLFIAALIVLPDLLTLFKFFLDNLRPIFSDNILDYWGIEIPFKRAKPYLGSFKILLIIISLLLVYPQITYLYSITTSGTLAEKPLPQTQRIIAIHYIWMSNPTHNPNVRDGDWLNSYLTPVEGYYESKQPYLEGDVENIKNIGFNTILVEIYPGKAQPASLLAKEALDIELRIAPYIDLGRLFKLAYISSMNPNLGNGTVALGYYALKDTSMSFILSTLYEALGLFDMPNAVKYKENYTIFVDGINLVLPSFDREALNYQLETLAFYLNISQFNTTALLEALSSRWGVTLSSLEDVYSIYPQNISDFMTRNDKIGLDARFIYQLSVERFWRETIQTIRSLNPNITIFAGIGRDPLKILNESIFIEAFDGIYYSRYQFLELLKVTQNDTLIGDEVLQLNSRTEIKTSYMYIDNTTDGPTPYLIAYETTLKESLNSNASIILVFSWNDYIEGFVIEPTIELDETQVDITKQIITESLSIDLSFIQTDYRRKEP